MGLAHSPQIVTDGLVLYLDAANRKSTISAAPASVITSAGWTTGSGGISGYSQNGDTVENERILATDPWGNNSVVWETRPTGTTDADGGWNSSFFSIDKTKLYRFSVWVRRTSSSAGGTFYLGTGAGGQEVMRTDNGAEQGNPYWECEGTGVLTQNVWYLVCGHIYPFNTTYTGRHPDTGFFTIANGPTKVRDVNGCNIGNDLKWAPGSTSALHRTYLYYCADNTTRLQFAFPRVDICDGNEPSIAELLNNGDSVWKDLSQTPSNVSWSGNPKHTILGGNRCWRFSSVGDKFNGTLLTSPGTRSASIETIIYPEADVQADDRACLLLISGASSIYMSWNKSNQKLSNYWYSHPTEGYHETGAAINRNTWNYLAAVWDYSSATIYQYTNGVLTSSSGVQGDASPGTNIQIGQEGGSRQFAGAISLIRVYNRALTTQEITQNYIALKGRFGL